MSLCAQRDQVHDLDEDGCHEPEECEVCIEQNHSSSCPHRCGQCCEELLIETSLRDAEREPRIRAECSPIISDCTGVRETIGYLLNDPAKHHACHFLDATTKLCTIYKTRPLVCRVFDCQKASE